MKTTICRAAICYEYGKPLIIEEVTLEPPAKGEVRVRNAATSICHSDIHAIKAEHGTWSLPAIAGHEICGYIDAVGDGVTYVKRGDLVIATLVPAGCGQCYYCRIGDPGHCQTYPGNLHPPGKYINKNGTRITQLEGYLGGFAEYTTIPEVYVVKIPDDTPVDRASLVACGVISGFGAVVNRAKVQPNKSVVVVGTGGVGLNAIQGAAFAGAYPIIAVDILDSKLETAKAFGATHVMNTRTESDPIKKAWEITYGRGADYVIISVAGVEGVRSRILVV
jgi:S-(hydroxymethyl)glutathione dehydrogenase / alcohol dehydrogenase